MPEQGTQYQSPLILQLFNNRQAQLTAEAQNNPEGDDHLLEFSAEQPTEKGFEWVTEWIGVFLQVFWLALLSGSVLLIWLFVLRLAGY
jgi:hypothetical protein